MSLGGADGYQLQRVVHATDRRAIEAVKRGKNGGLKLVGGVHHWLECQIVGRRLVVDGRGNRFEPMAPERIECSEARAAVVRCTDRHVGRYCGEAVPRKTVDQIAWGNVDTAEGKIVGSENESPGPEVFDGHKLRNKELP